MMGRLGEASNIYGGRGNEDRGLTSTGEEAQYTQFVYNVEGGRGGDFPALVYIQYVLYKETALTIIGLPVHAVGRLN